MLKNQDLIRSTFFFASLKTFLSEISLRKIRGAIAKIQAILSTAAFVPIV